MWGASDSCEGPAAVYLFCNLLFVGLLRYVVTLGNLVVLWAVTLGGKGSKGSVIAPRVHKQ